MSPSEPVGPEHGRPAGRRYYPDLLAQSHKSISVVSEPWELGFQGHFVAPPEPPPELEPESQPQAVGQGEGVQLELLCPGWATFGECEDGHHFAKELICNREWCPECGGKDGKGHQRRKASWLPKVRQMESIGYFVPTVPPELREEYRDPRVLAEKGKAFKRLMQRLGFSRGLRRWHWFGEDHRGEGDHDGAVPGYHPHLNVLVGAGYIEPELLDKVKRGWGRILGVPLARVNVYYEYATTVPKMLHLMNYVLRPTFTHWEWDQELAYRVIGFRHTLSWGKWDGEPLWDVPAGESPSSQLLAVNEGRCPVDGKRIKWSNIGPAKNLREPDWEGLGGGYWMFNGLARDGVP